MLESLINRRIGDKESTYINSIIDSYETKISNLDKFIVHQESKYHGLDLEIELINIKKETGEINIEIFDIKNEKETLERADDATFYVKVEDNYYLMLKDIEHIEKNKLTIAYLQNYKKNINSSFTQEKIYSDLNQIINVLKKDDESLLVNSDFNSNMPKINDFISAKDEVYSLLGDKIYLELFVSTNKNKIFSILDYENLQKVIDRFEGRVNQRIISCKHFNTEEYGFESSTINEIVKLKEVLEYYRNSLIKNKNDVFSYKENLNFFKTLNSYIINNKTALKIEVRETTDLLITELNTFSKFFKQIDFKHFVEDQVHNAFKQYETNVFKNQVNEDTITSNEKFKTIEDSIDIVLDKIELKHDFSIQENKKLDIKIENDTLFYNKDLKITKKNDIFSILSVFKF